MAIFDSFKRKVGERPTGDFALYDNTKPPEKIAQKAENKALAVKHAPIVTTEEKKTESQKMNARIDAYGNDEPFDERFGDDPDCVNFTDSDVASANRLIKVFNVEQLHQAHKKNQKGDDRARLPYIEAALERDGEREIPDFTNVRETLMPLADKFPNLSAALAFLADELELASVLPPDQFKITPILLNGAPGIGKTAFVMAISELLNLKFEQLNAGGLQTGAQIVGSASYWSNSLPSSLFWTMASGTSAVFLLLIDEIDKANDDNNILPALLTLLEPISAQRTKCECTAVQHDLSRLIIIATSNERDKIYPALLSRCSVFEIENPTDEQRAQIARKAHESLCNKSNREVMLDERALADIAQSDCDLRALQMAIRSGFAEALRSKTLPQVSYPVVRDMKTKRARMGFMSS